MLVLETKSYDEVEERTNYCFCFGNVEKFSLLTGKHLPLLKNHHANVTFTIYKRALSKASAYRHHLHLQNLDFVYESIIIHCLPHRNMYII